jgi:predicted DNA-binding transcriptional regulator AlpA
MLMGKNESIDNESSASVPKAVGQYTEKPAHLVFLNEKEFCDITGQKISTARSYRIMGGRCNFYKIGGSVRYKLSEVIEYIEGCKCSSTTKKS